MLGYIIQPGVGVDNNTGLPYATAYGFYAFTDWDLGVYIQAIIDAQELNLIPLMALGALMQE